MDQNGIISKVVTPSATVSKDKKDHKYPPVDFEKIKKIVDQWNEELHIAVKGMQSNKIWCDFFLRRGEIWISIRNVLRKKDDGSIGSDKEESIEIPIANMYTMGPRHFNKGFDNHNATKDLVQRMILLMPFLMTKLLQLENGDQYYKERTASQRK